MASVKVPRGLVCQRPRTTRTPLVDPIPAFQQVEPAYFDSIHPRERGHLLIAQELSAAILAQHRAELAK